MLKKSKRLMVVASLFLIFSLVFTAAAQAEVKNIILMIGDGMGIGQMDMTRYMAGDKDYKLEMMKMPNVGLMMTSSTEGVTDSAAAGTAMATGNKVYNGAVAMNKNGAELDSVLDFAEVRNKATGIISTNMVTDATPATFAASVKDRGMGGEIAKQILDNDVDVVLGGGREDFMKEEAGEDLIAKAKKMGYQYVTDKEQLKRVMPMNGKVLGLFNDSYMNYIKDRDDLDSKEPSLLEMTTKAIDVLSEDEDGFFLMAEGARIDHAAHAADVPGVVAETLDFDASIKYAVDWARENGNTMVVVVADHETLGFSVTEPINKEALMNIEVSPEYMAGKLVETESGNAYTIDSIQRVFKEYANLELTEKEAREFNSNIVNEDDGSLYYQYKVGWQIGSIIAEKNNVGVVAADVRAKSDTGGHTLNSVPIFAFGPETEDFNGVIQNTEFSKVLFEAMRP
ncbi:alkaline phosphatase [Halanaerobium sp. ST460_2HS_T2]|uniref:alkaline phosphatase n=1 Tax=Halanaerobium sp. ST460_2HS_T2 TaxID=2183914 RepID=UPI000DF40EC4|nr:alkaline phosphatase [Halanaerobium sp. ST460_2HS_T2]RCW60323.1 alkaline phosphatase [Halanaerobium sp. ST460_2HS_T2]